MKDVDDESKITNFYNTGANRMKFFDPTAENADQEATGTWVPKMPMIPAKVALKVATSPRISWVHQHLCNYEEDRDQAVKEMLKKAKIWALTATCKGASKESSIMAYSLPPVTLPSSALQRQLKKRRNSTLGTRTDLAPMPMCNQPNAFLPMSPQQIATGVAMASMAAAQPTASSISDIYSQGAMAAMRMYTELRLTDTIYKRLTDVQQGALMGFCNTKSCASVPSLESHRINKNGI